MARISAGEGLGDVVARPVLQNELQTPRGAFGGGGAIEDAGANVTAIGDQAARERAKAEHEAKMLRDAADRATASGKLLDAQDQLTAAHDEISTGVATGTIDKTKAAETWQRRAAEITAATSDGVPAAHAQDFGNGVKRASMKLGRALELTVAKRDRQDVTAGIGTTLEYAARMYAKDPAMARQIAGDTLAQLGPFSDLAPDQLQKLGQNWKEAAAFTTAYTGINGARGSVAELKAWDKKLDSPEFADLDPQKKAQLITTSANYQTTLEQRAVHAAQRAEMAAQKRERESASAYTVLTDWARAGKAADPVASQALVAKLTPEHAAAYRAVAAEVPERTAAAMLPLDQQQLQLDALMARRNVSGTSQGLEHEITRRQQVLSEAKRDYELDPLRAASERNVIDAVMPIDMTKGVSGIVAGVTQRVQQAATVSTRTGKPVSPFLREEADKIGDILNALPPAQRSAATAQLAQAVPPAQMQALAAQIDKKDRGLALEMAAGVDRTNTGRNTSEWIARGRQAVADKAIKEDSAAMTGLRASLAAELGDALPGKAREDVIDAARFIFLGEKAAGLDPSVKGALRLALNGDLVEHNGRKIPTAHGISQDVLRDRLASMPPEALAPQVPDGAVYTVDGRKMPASEFLQGLPQAVLEPAGTGRYYVRAGAGTALNSRGKPIVIEVR